MNVNCLNSLCLDGYFTPDSGEICVFNCTTRISVEGSTVSWFFSRGTDPSEIFFKAYTDSRKTDSSLFSEISDEIVCDALQENDTVVNIIHATKTSVFVDECCWLRFESEGKCCFSVSIESESLILRLNYFFIKECDALPKEGGMINYANVSGVLKVGETTVAVSGYGCLTQQHLESPSFRILGHLDSGKQFFVCFKPSENTEHECSWKLFGESLSSVSGTTMIRYLSEWMSLITFQSYPTEAEFFLNSLNLSIRFIAQCENQEKCSFAFRGCGQLVTSFVGECVNSSGTAELLRGCISCSNNSGLPVKAAMRKIGRLVQSELSKKLMNSPATPLNEYMFDAVYQPIKILVDRGGKSWRSFLFCIIRHLFTSQHFECIGFLQAIELLHVGSLIIDDIEDQSEVRRGGACVHNLVGLPTALNSGSACFFSALHFAGANELPPTKCLKVYQLTMETLRLGHLGQGLDVHGVEKAVENAINSTCDPSTLLSLVEKIHELKTGELVSFICKLGCILSDITDPVTDAISVFGRNLGISFQILDDVLDMTGRGDRKKFAEDLRNKKITYPIAKAFQLLSTTAERQQLLHKILHPTNDNNIEEILSIVKNTTAFEQSKIDAREKIANQWKIVEPQIPSSLTKVYLHHFCQLLIGQAHK